MHSNIIHLTVAAHWHPMPLAEFLLYYLQYNIPIVVTSSGSRAKASSSLGTSVVCSGAMVLCSALTMGGGSSSSSGMCMARLSSACSSGLGACRWLACGGGSTSACRVGAPAISLGGSSNNPAPSPTKLSPAKQQKHNIL